MPKIFPSPILQPRAMIWNALQHAKRRQAALQFSWSVIILLALFVKALRLPALPASLFLWRPPSFTNICSAFCKLVVTLQRRRVAASDATFKSFCSLLPAKQCDRTVRRRFWRLRLHGMFLTANECHLASFQTAKLSRKLNVVDRLFQTARHCECHMQALCGNPKQTAIYAKRDVSDITCFIRSGNSSEWRT